MSAVPSRDATRARPGKRIAIAIALIAFAILPLFLKSYGTYLCTLFCVTLMATYGLNLTVGYAGQMSLGQAAFYGIGAYIAAIALKAGIPFFVVLPAAGAACFIVVLALGFPALRVQQHYLAFATLGFNILVYLVMRNEEKITGGTYGISGIPRPSLFGLSLDGRGSHSMSGPPTRSTLMSLLTQACELEHGLAPRPEVRPLAGRAGLGVAVVHVGQGAGLRRGAPPRHRHARRGLRAPIHQPG